MLKLFCLAGAVLGFIGVAAGSFGAHGLKDMLEANGQAANWETAVRYCLFHAVVLVAIAGLAASPGASSAGSLLTIAASCFLAGVLIFSGFLGVLALTGIRILGAIVPIGGVLLLVGWAALIAALWRLKL
ncbi:MAG: DUF423 domain-containing protein [Pirellulales bacterium]